MCDGLVTDDVGKPRSTQPNNQYPRLFSCCSAEPQGPPKVLKQLEIYRCLLEEGIFPSLFCDQVLTRDATTPTRRAYCASDRVHAEENHPERRQFTKPKPNCATPAHAPMMARPKTVFPCWFRVGSDHSG